MREEVVVIIHQPPRVLLGRKKRGIGSGRYNGLGGGVENGETLEEAAIRETFGEARITPINPKRLGRILFQFESGEQDHLVHFFRAENFGGIPEETEEMSPEWFREREIPYDSMWVADKHWMPHLLKDRRFSGKFNYDSEHKIISYNLVAGDGVKVK